MMVFVWLLPRDLVVGIVVGPAISSMKATLSRLGFASLSERLIICTRARASFPARSYLLGRGITLGPTFIIGRIRKR
jgi:hypothetical protein